jgi:hypothetical protein
MSGSLDVMLATALAIIAMTVAMWGVSLFLRNASVGAIGWGGRGSSSSLGLLGWSATATPIAAHSSPPWSLSGVCVSLVISGGAVEVPTSTSATNLCAAARESSSDSGPSSPSLGCRGC